MPIMPVDEYPKCQWLECAAGCGLAGSGNCFLGGAWDDSECPAFIPETFVMLENYVFSHFYDRYAGEIEEVYQDKEMWDLVSQLGWNI